MPLLAAAMTCGSAVAERVVILHTNDTHSQVDPLADGTGGVARRKALIDSVRAAEPNVILVDAGDAVQGSLFFTLFHGEVEQKLLNLLGYDIQILGNHEFDNGLDALKRQLDAAIPQLLSTNYDFSATPLDGMFSPFAVREAAGHKLGLFAVNINPEGLIDGSGYEGMRYLDAYEAADAMAWYLRNIVRCDKVIAVTHIGYDDINGVNDVALARRSKNIDIVIGGHSHTLVDPASDKARIPNAVGDTVLVLQTRNKGSYLGEIDIDFPTGRTDARLISVDSRLDSRLDPAVDKMLAPYRHKVDSIISQPIGKSAVDLDQKSPRTLNWLTDYVKTRGEELSGAPVDLAIMNKGGIRNSIPKGTVTKGQVMEMLPFTNYIVVMEIKGSDLLENFAVMGRQDGNGISEGTEVVYRPGSGEVVSATVGGRDVDPDAVYRLATISYLAKGGDYMVPLTRGKIISQSKNVIFDDIIGSMEHGSMHGRKLDASAQPRMKPANR